MPNGQGVSRAQRVWIARHGAALGTALVIAASGRPPAALAAAQNEDALKAFFEGRHVVTRIDLPGTQEGVDVHVDARQRIDYREYGDRLKRFGTALRAGDAAVVTLVKVKKDVIEFQLSGGGYGTFGDDTSTSVYIPSVEKSEREKDLERLVRDERDDHRRHELQRELDELRDRRDRENRRLEIERERASEIKREEVAERRLHGGSRFNIRYGTVPKDITPDDVVAALSEFVDFSSLGWPPAGPPPVGPVMIAPAAPGASEADLRKGMLREDVERRLGPPNQTTDHREGNVTVATLVFVRGDDRITADFIDDVLVRYTISSR
jgi:hypothetical protein